MLVKEGIAEKLDPYEILQSQIAEDAVRLMISGELSPPIIGEETLFESGSYSHRRRWLEGYHPKLGSLHHNGWRHRETIAEVDVIKALKTFEVK